MLERVALLSVLGLVLSTVPDIASWQIACVLGLVWAWGWSHWHEGMHDGFTASHHVLEAANKTLEEAKKMVENYEARRKAEEHTQ